MQCAHMQVETALQLVQSTLADAEGDEEGALAADQDAALVSASIGAVRWQQSDRWATRPPAIHKGSGRREYRSKHFRSCNARQRHCTLHCTCVRLMRLVYGSCTGHIKGSMGCCHTPTCQTCN